MDAFQVRDDLVAQDVARMAELGRFETQFVFYGCAYYDKGKIMAAVSDKSDKIYDFIYDSKNISKFPTKLHTIRYSTIVQSGEQKPIEQMLKEKLLMELKNTYTLDYFKRQEMKLSSRTCNDNAYSILKSRCYVLDGICNDDEINLFSSLLEVAYSKKTISEQHYYEFKKWISWCRRDLLDAIVKKDVYQQEFSGFAYKDKDGKTKICIDGSKTNAYKKREKIIAEGLFVTPMITKQWGYNHSYGVPDARKDCERYFQKIFTNDYIEQLQTISEL